MVSLCRLLPNVRTIPVFEYSDGASVEPKPHLPLCILPTKFMQSFQHEKAPFSFLDAGGLERADLVACVLLQVHALQLTKSGSGISVVLPREPGQWQRVGRLGTLNGETRRERHVHYYGLAHS